MVYGDNSFTTDTKGTEEWEHDNYFVITRLWNKMESFISASFIFLDSVKDIRNELHAMPHIPQTKMPLESSICTKTLLD